MKATFTSTILLVFLLAGINSASAQCTTLLYRDADGDGFGNPAINITSCNSRSGYVVNSDDCDDSNRAFGKIKRWYLDADGDGYGNPTISVLSCSPPAGYVEFGIDQIDGNPVLMLLYDDGTYGKQCVAPSKTSFVKHYADCSLNEADTIQTGPFASYVYIYNAEGTLTNEAFVGNGSLVAVPNGCHARVFYLYPCWSNNPNEPYGETNIDTYEDFYFEKCTTISGEDSVCAGGFVTLSAQKDVESEFTWYDAQSGGNLLHTGTVFQTSALATGQYTYWISTDGGPRRSITVTSLGTVINNKPENITVAATANSCTATVNFRSPYATDLCMGTTSEVEFRGTGAYQTWVVPQNIYSVNIDAVGARSNGGPGRVQTTLAVTPGETLYINVASGSYPNGGSGATESAWVEEAGWWFKKEQSGRSGGGSTQVGRTGNMLTDTLVVAGGGGGNAYRWFIEANEIIGFGGNGGYVADASPGQPNFMQGMSAQPDWDITDVQVGGGGGGGYYGGLADVLDGDGASPGQGGGSHVAAAGSSNTVFTEGYGVDHSYVRITYAKEFAMVQTAGLPSGSAFPLGITPMKFKYTNGNGVTDSCSFNVTVTGTAPTWYRDADGDTYGDLNTTTQSCTQPEGYVSNNTDCNDAIASIHPGATEVCGNGIDENCNGNADDVCPCYSYVDNDGDGYGNTATATQVPCGTGIPGQVGIGGDCNDNNPAIHPGATEICGNGIDENCNGNADDVCPCYSYVDNDGDGYGNTATATQVPCGTGIPGQVGIGGDCNDNNPAIHPGATEICGNGIDENCNGNADDVCPCYSYVDNDGDGYGNTATATQVPCGTGIPGQVGIGGDCNDNNPAIHPAATEICGNGIDENCNGNADDVCPCYSYVDNDGDGYGNTATATQVPCGTGIPGQVGIGGDCNDANSAIHPGATEICGNGIDENCNGSADDICPCYVYLDNDGDGYGQSSTATQVPCDMGIPGYVGRGGDCNDNNPAIHPGATEICGNGIDENCDGIIAFCPVTFYIDSDGDGYGKNENPLVINDGSAPTSGYSTQNGDCNDNNPAIHPGAIEICGNAIDDNCNGVADEGCVTCTSAPAKPGDITGSIAVCAGSQNVVYGIPTVSKATSYDWVISGGIIVSGQGTNTITVNFPASYSSSTLKVRALNACGASGYNKAITIKPPVTPAQPSSITGPVNVCPGSTGVVYKIAAVSGASGYNWVVTNGAVVTSYAGTTSFSYNFPLAYSSLTIKVQAINSCGVGSAYRSTASITPPAAPATPGIISGNAQACGRSTLTYSVASVTNAVSYVWMVTAPAQIQKGQGTGSVDVKFPNTFSSVTLSVRSVNACGVQSAASTKTISYKNCTAVSISTKPDAITEDGVAALSIYPNPARHIFTVDLKLPHTEVTTATIQVLNSIGQVIYTTQGSVLNNKLRKELNTPQHFASGIYWVRILVDDNIYNSKLLIQK